MININNIINNIDDIISRYLSSEDYLISVKAKRYYKNKNDILDKRRYYIVNGQQKEDRLSANNKIAHPIFRDLVDQKVNYLLGNDWSVENKELSEVFDDDFRSLIQSSTADSIMCGLGWIFVLPDNKFKYIDSLNIIPIWEDIKHRKLFGVIHFYTAINYDQNGVEKKEQFAELWSLEGVHVFKKNENDKYDLIEIKSHLTYNYEQKKYEDNNMVKPNIKNNYNWQKLPFIYIKYNEDEVSLLSLVKSLIDNMDKTASDTQDLLSDLTNKITVITGATGTNLREFAINKRQYRTVSLPMGADCKEIGTDPNIDAAKSWIEHLRSQIYIAGRGYDPLQAIGLNASGEARRNLYTSLDLDVNQLESGILQAIKRVIWFINANPIGMGQLIPEDTKVTFVRNIMINQGEQVENALKAQNIEGISMRTVVGMSGLTENVEEEIKLAEEEKKERMEQFADVYNFGKDDNKNKKQKNEDKDKKSKSKYTTQKEGLVESENE